MKDKALFLFAAIGALWVVIEMYNFFRAPSADLVATVHHGEAVTPPDVYRHLRSLQALTEYESWCAWSSRWLSGSGSVAANVGNALGKRCARQDGLREPQAEQTQGAWRSR